MERPKGSGRNKEVRGREPEEQRAALDAAFIRLLSKQQRSAGRFTRRYVEKDVLYIKTFGDVDDVQRALELLQGFEIVGQSSSVADDDDTEVDEDSESSSAIDRTQDAATTASSSFYFVATDSKSLETLVRYWTWFKGGLAMPYGYAPLRRLFEQIDELRYWNADDRLSEQAACEDLQFELERGAESVPLELELWYRSSPTARSAIEDYWRHETATYGGVVVSTSCLPQIRYHALLLRLPPDVVRRMIINRDVSFVSDSSVYLVQEVGQSVDGGSADASNLPGVEISQSVDDSDAEASQPICALLDTLPVANHPALAGRVVVDDHFGWESSVTVDMREHGTAMASLIVNGDLALGGRRIRRPLLCAPILKPVKEKGDSFPDDRLIVDVIHERVVALCENEAYSSLRVINLSIGDSRISLRDIVSKIGRIVDYLAYKYRLLFIVSAGNVDSRFQIAIGDVFSNLSDAHLLELVFPIVDTKKKRICSPADAVNAITVGAINSDGCALANPPGSRVFPAAGIVPAPYSRRGPGFRDSLKPELAVSAGRMAYRDIGRQVRQLSSGPPGQEVARARGNTFFTRGTSNAAALVSRQAHLAYEHLMETLSAKLSPKESARFEAVALKALLGHATDDLAVDSIVALFPHMSRKDFDLFLRSTSGYGALNESRLATCAANRALLIGVADLQEDVAHEFLVPIPESMTATATRRRISMTVGYLTPTNCANVLYRKAKVQIVVARPDLERSFGVTRPRVSRHESARGTLQHLDFEGSGVVLRDESELKIRVECRSEAGLASSDNIPYCLVVSIEADDVANSAIYDEVSKYVALRAASLVNLGVNANVGDRSETEIP